MGVGGGVAGGVRSCSEDINNEGPSQCRWQVGEDFFTCDVLRHCCQYQYCQTGELVRFAASVKVFGFTKPIKTQLLSLKKKNKMGPESSTVGFWRARGAREDKRCWRRKTDEEEMFLLASLPAPAALTVSVSSSVSSCHCSAAELGPAVRRRPLPRSARRGCTFVMFVRGSVAPQP